MDVSAAPIRAMEPVIAERLRIAFPEADFALQRVPSVLSQAEFKRFVEDTPFIGLAWMGLTPGKLNGRQLQGAWRWRVILIVKNSHNLEARFKGDAFEPGLDAMVDVALALLQGAVFPGIGASTVTGAEAVYAEGFADEAIAIAQVDFEIATTSTLAPFGLKTAEDFERLGITWSTGAGTPPIVAAAPEHPQEV